MHFINAKFCGNGICSRLSVSGQHNCLFHTDLFHIADRIFAALFDSIGDHDTSGKHVVACHIDNRSGSLVFRVSDILCVHQFCIANVYFPAINKCMDSVSCDLLRICDALHGKCFSICFADRVRDRMVGITLAVRCDLQQFFFSDCVVFVRGRLYFRNLKFTLGQCTGLVKHDRCHLGNCL